MSAGRFDPRELPADQRGTGEDGLDLLATARELEAVAGADPTMPSVGFEDRVMAALADEAPPRVIARGWTVGGFLSTVRDAWNIAGSGGRPAAVRLQALALVLLVAVAAASVGSVAAIGAARWLESRAVPTETREPQPSFPPSPAPSALPSPSPSVTPSPGPSETAEPSEQASPTDEETDEPTASATDDDSSGGNSGPGGGDDDGGGGNSGPGGGDDPGGSGDSSGSDDRGGSG